MRDAVPVVGPFRKRHERIVAPGIGVVPLPGVEVFGADAGGHSVAVRGGAEGGGGLCEKLKCREKTDGNRNAQQGHEWKGSA